MKHKLYNRLLSLALAVGLVIGMLPSAAAVDTVGTAGNVQSTTTESQFDEAAEPYAYSVTLGNVYYNLNGQEIEGNDITIWRRNTINFSDITPPSGYEFSRATVEGKERSYLYYDGEEIFADSNRRNEVSENAKIVIYYTKAVPLETVPTVDSVKDGVHIQMFDYDASGNRGGVNIYAGDRNRSQGLAFISGNSSYGGSGQNTYVGAGQPAFYGILKNKLDANGFPALKNPYQKPTIDYLFDENSTGVTAYKGAANSDGVYSLNHLFLQSEYDATGYYVYDSAENFATLYDENGRLNTSVEDFRVYKTANDNGASLDSPKFLPFNDLSSRTHATSNENFHFGMKMDFKFVQPKDGKVTYKGNTSNMVFTFNGDDDVWVFIDDVLVLDIGGIHQAITGTIDFATGEVLVYYPDGQRVSKRTTIYDAYRDAGYTSEQLNSIFTRTADGNYIFKNYSNHTFNYYYFERGAGGSNCQMKFNIQTVPDGVIQVGKEITQAVEPGFSDAKFDMKVEVANETDGVYSAFAPYVGTYDIKSLKDNSIVKEGLTTEDGTFTLQNGQYAELKDNIKATTKYKVTELAVYGYESDYEFDLSETSMVDQEGGSVSGELGNSKEILVGETPQIVVQNKFKYNAENPKYMFTVQKQMAEGQTTKDPFTFEITNSRGEPYTGDYYVRKIGEALPNKPQQSPDGRISIQAGQEIVILGVTSGSTFVVKEVGLDTNSYENPTYASSGNCEGQAVEGGYSVTIQSTPGTEEVTATVTATNTLKSGSLTIEKVISGNLSQSDFDKLKESLTFTVTGDKYNNTFKLSEFITKPADGFNGTYSMTIDNIPVGSYTVTESGYEVADYDWKKVETTVDVTVTSGTTPVKASFTNDYTRQTGSLTITKTVEGLENDSDTLGILKNQLTFTVTGPNNYSEEIAFNATGWKQDGNTYSYTIDDLPTGKYTVTESGYELAKYGYNWTGTKNPVEGTVNDDDSVTVPFTNTYTPANIKLTITKEIQGNSYGDGRDMFSFRITCIDCADDTNVGKVWYVSIKGAGSKTITLPVGQYSVEELNNMHYELVSVDPPADDLSPSTGTRGIIKWGYDLQEDKEITFTNKMKPTDIPTDGGGVVNLYVQENGEWVFKKDEDLDGEPDLEPTPSPKPEQ